MSNYPPNIRNWHIGQEVIHYADAKRPDMLMRIIDIESSPDHSELIYVTEYIDPSHIYSIGKKFVKRQVFRNSLENLLDPNDFMISVPIIIGGKKS